MSNVDDIDDDAFHDTAANFSTNESESELQDCIPGDSYTRAFEYDFSNSSFFSSSVQLRSHNNNPLSVDDECFDVDNVAPESLYVDKEDFIRLHNLSEFQRESILAERMEMLRSEHAMNKALHQVTSTVGDERDGKESGNVLLQAISIVCDEITVETALSPEDALKSTNKFIERGAVSASQEELEEHVSLITVTDNVKSTSVSSQNTALSGAPQIQSFFEACVPAVEARVVRGRGRGRPPGRAAASRSRTSGGRSSNQSRSCGRGGASNDSQRSSAAVPGRGGRGHGCPIGHGKSGRLPSRPAALQVQAGWEVHPLENLCGNAHFGNQQDVIDFLVGERCRNYVDNIQQNLSLKLSLH